MACRSHTYALRDQLGRRGLCENKRKEEEETWRSTHRRRELEAEAVDTDELPGPFRPGSPGLGLDLHSADAIEVRGHFVPPTFLH